MTVSLFLDSIAQYPLVLTFNILYVHLRVALFSLSFWNGEKGMIVGAFSLTGGGKRPLQTSLTREWHLSLYPSLHIWIDWPFEQRD